MNVIELKTRGQAGFEFHYDKVNSMVGFEVNDLTTYEISKDNSVYAAFKILLKVSSYLNGNESLLFKGNESGEFIRISEEDKIIIEFSNSGIIFFDLSESCNEEYIFSELYTLLSYEESITIKPAISKQRRKHLTIIK